jgi:hypothetical protein
MIQTTVPISSGSSGGALLDVDGRLIGLTTAGFQNAQNLNFAVPINAVRDALPHAIARVQAEEQRQIRQKAEEEVARRRDQELERRRLAEAEAARKGAEEEAKRKAYEEQQKAEEVRRAAAEKCRLLANDSLVPSGRVWAESRVNGETLGLVLRASLTGDRCLLDVLTFAGPTVSMDEASVVLRQRW